MCRSTIAWLQRIISVYTFLFVPYTHDGPVHIHIRSGAVDKNAQ